MYHDTTVEKFNSLNVSLTIVNSPNNTIFHDKGPINGSGTIPKQYTVLVTTGRKSDSAYLFIIQLLLH